MYKCIDCQKLYDIKPDFCSCGGNSFELTETEQAAYKTESEVAISSIREKLSPQQIVSVAIFVLCLILAVIPWFIKSAAPKIQEKTPVLEKQNVKVPDIDSFWDNTPAAKPIEKQLEVPDNEAGANKSVKFESVKKKELTTKPAVKPVTKGPAKTVSKSASPAQTNTEAPQSKVDPNAMYNYKKNLSIALASKMNFLNIHGSGKCAVQFSVSSTGKLLNRGFVYQSDNKSINDEVYNMLMRLPNFQAPPSGYNGETIKMTFEFNNGDYKFSFYD